MDKFLAMDFETYKRVVNGKERHYTEGVKEFDSDDEVQWEKFDQLNYSKGLTRAQNSLEKLGINEADFEQSCQDQMIRALKGPVDKNELFRMSLCSNLGITEKDLTKLYIYKLLDNKVIKKDKVKT